MATDKRDNNTSPSRDNDGAHARHDGPKPHRQDDPKPLRPHFRTPFLKRSPDKQHLSVYEWLVRVATYRRGMHIVLAAFVGIAAGVVGVIFHYAIAGATYLFTGYTDYTDHVYESHGYLPIPWWFIAFTPLIASLIYGPILARWGEQARGSGIPEVMLAVRRQGGRIPGRIAFIKIIAASLTLGGGGSVGREGPVVQVGASVGSWIAQVFRQPKQTIIIMAGCGAGAGVAAMFNAPLAGAIFALEAILVSINARTIGLVAISSVGAAVTGQLLIGDRLMITIPKDLQLVSNTDMFFVAILGILAGLLGVIFQKTQYGIGDIINKLYDGPAWAKPVVGSLIIGPLLLIFPYVYGLAYPVQMKALTGQFTVVFLLYLIFARILMTSLTIGWGGSGGVFGPSLFIGACLGAAMGQIVDPWTASSPEIFGVIGMGALFAGAARTPLSAVLLILEMTGQYSLIIPMMLAVAFATAVSRFLTRKTIYTEKLARQGANLDDPVHDTLLARQKVTQFMTDPPAVLDGSMTLAEASEAMHVAGGTPLPVVRSDDDPLFIGSISPLMVARAQQAKRPDETPIKDLKLNRTYVRPTALPSKVMRTILDSPMEAVPVVREGELIGWVSQHDLVELLYRQQRRALNASEAQSSWGLRMQRRWQSLMKEREDERDPWSDTHQ